MTRRRNRLWPALLTALAALPLLAHVFLGLYNRGVADDLCFTAIARDNGIFAALDYWYNNWTGTYSSTFFQSVVGLARAWQFVPGTLIMLWWGAAIWLFYQLGRFLNLTHPLSAAGLLGTLLVYGINAGTSNEFQSLYWTSGAITYSLPVIVFTFHLGFLLLALRRAGQDRVPLPYLMLSGGLSMLAGGFSPLYAVFQTATLFILGLMAIRVAPPKQRRSAAILMANACIFALIALVILTVAPGNTVRQERLGDRLDIVGSLLLGMTLTLGFFPLTFGILATVPLLSAFFGAAAVGLKSPDETTRPGPIVLPQGTFLVAVKVLIPVILAVLYPIFFTSAFLVQGTPPPRGIVIPMFALLLWTLLLGYLVGSQLRAQRWHPNPVLQWIGRALLLIVLIAGPVAEARQVLSYVPVFRTYALEWDQKDAEVRLAAANGLRVYTLEPYTYDIAYVMNIVPAYEDCFRDYYQLERVIVQAAAH